MLRYTFFVESSFLSFIIYHFIIIILLII